jgi:hypothetical protein
MNNKIIKKKEKQNQKTPQCFNASFSASGRVLFIKE